MSIRRGRRRSRSPYPSDEKTQQSECNHAMIVRFFSTYSTHLVLFFCEIVLWSFISFYQRVFSTVMWLLLLFSCWTISKDVSSSDWLLRGLVSSGNIVQFLFIRTNKLDFTVILDLICPGRALLNPYTIVYDRAQPNTLRITVVFLRNTWLSITIVIPRVVYGRSWLYTIHYWESN